MTPNCLATPAISRRALLRGGALLAAGTAFAPRLAFAAAPVERVWPSVAAMVEGYVPARLPEMIAALGFGGDPTQYIARGQEGPDDPDPVGPDSLFRLYSMTKPVTGMAAMILIDEGKLGLDQPLAEILPRFARMQVQAVPDGSLTDLVAARAPITIRHLLTHTAGLGYSVVQKGPLKTAFEDAGVISGLISRIRIPGFDRGTAVESLELFADRLAALPLVHQPGTRWSYSVGLDLMGRVIEVVAGMPFDRFLAERLFGPAGMTSTYFQVPAGEVGRLTTNYGIMGGFKLPLDPARTSIYLDPPPFPMGGAGLVGSPRDYDRFLAMLTGLGAIGGKRVMSEKAVRMGTGNLLPAGVDLADSWLANSGFGAGGRVGLGKLAGTYGWGGAAGTVALVDMNRRVRASLYTQYMPDSTYPVHADFPRAVVADLAAMKPAARARSRR